MGKMKQLKKSHYWNLSMLFCKWSTVIYREWLQANKTELGCACTWGCKMVPVEVGLGLPWLSAFCGKEKPRAPSLAYSHGTHISYETKQGYCYPSKQPCELLFLYPSFQSFPLQNPALLDIFSHSVTAALWDHIMIIMKVTVQISTCF